MVRMIKRMGEFCQWRMVGELVIASPAFFAGRGNPVFLVLECQLWAGLLRREEHSSQ
jgi:hypothetical protein